MPSGKPHYPPPTHTPCQLPLEQWRTCYANGCYLNYRCPVFCGTRVSPERDYIPLPPVFVLWGAGEAVPLLYKIPKPNSDAA
ncbi:MAG: hypothetical protein ABH878_02745 [bacterium]